MTIESINHYIKMLEKEGWISPTCEYCKAAFYPELEHGAKFGNIFAPRHRASKNCKSGMNSHCTCDSCF